MERMQVGECHCMERLEQVRQGLVLSYQLTAELA